MRKPISASSAAMARPQAPAAATSGASSQSGRSGGGAAMSELAAESPAKEQESRSHGANSVAMALSAGSEREERAKKSVAYQHTEFHELQEDSSGKSYERRMCCYCEAVFSFKGGTTSAALRHLKSAHRERLLYAGLGISGTTASGSASTTTDSAIETAPSMTHSSVSRPVTGEFSAMLTAARAPRAPVKHNDPEAGTALPSAPSATLSSTVEASLSGVESHNDAIHTTGSEAEETLGGTVVASTPIKEQSDNGTAKRKRDEAGADESNAVDVKDSKLALEPVMQMTASQMAIRHFLHHHAEEMPLPSMRLSFAKYLAHNVVEAEMYNVLDAPTRLEYVREFAMHSSPHGQL